MSNLIWLYTKVKILINRVNVLAEVYSLINSNILYKIKICATIFKLKNHNYWLPTDIDKILHIKFKLQFLFRYIKF